MVESAPRTVGGACTDAERLAHVLVIAECECVVGSQQEAVRLERVVERLRALLRCPHEQRKRRVVEAREELGAELPRVLAAAAGELVRGHARDGVGIERKQLDAVELGRRLHHPVEAEALLEELVVELLDVVARAPAVQGQEVAEHLGQIAGAAEVVDVDLGQLHLERLAEADRALELKLDVVVAKPARPLLRGHRSRGWCRQRPLLDRLAEHLVLVALRHLRVVGILDDREVAVDGPTESERILEQHVLGRVREVLLRAEDMGDAHQLVVDHHGKVVGGKAVLLADDEVVDLACGKRRVSQDLVVDGDRDLAGAKADDGLTALRDELSALVGGNLAPEAVSEGLLARHRVLAHGLELLGAVPCFVRLALVDQALAVAVVDREALALEIGAVWPPADGRAIGREVLRSLVPADPEPIEVLQEADARGVRRALLIGVLDPDDEAPAAPLGVGPREERGAGATYVEVTGGRRRETSDRGGVWGRHGGSRCGGGSVADAPNRGVCRENR